MVMRRRSGDSGQWYGANPLLTVATGFVTDEMSETLSG